jgi:hypothetical protein
LFLIEAPSRMRRVIIYEFEKGTYLSILSRKGIEIEEFRL